ncbi:MAG: leucine--tRNA ligase [Saprospiraceae bacterium]|nr:leucine--tRNA ligase [Saprospiraceae bacterium]
MDYNFPEIEKKWQKYWAENKTFKAENKSKKPKYYVLDMFPYPSGAGLHVGHPLGYIASDIYSRYKRLKGFNVLHPMGYDAYGLPAEQYAIQTGTHPAITTEKNLKRYREQLDRIGFSFDWDREVKTSDPFYYKWTQWTFIQLFNSWYNNKTQKAEKISELIKEFENNGNSNVEAACSEIEMFTPEYWKSSTEKEQQEILMNYRLAYLSDTVVNWCPELGTVLANDEVKEGLSVRGGYAVEKKSMRQWSLRITAYADRLLEGLERIDWSDSIKEVQKNWIGKSNGCSLVFDLKNISTPLNVPKIEVFTTRSDTIFGSTFMVLAPEHELVPEITSPENKAEVEEYISWAKNRSERERMSEVKKISGKFTGAYAINPFSGKEMPIWIADYVLAGYGTGAVMAVPGHDARDYAFAKHFGLEIKEVVQGGNIEEEAYEAKEGIMVNSEFINGMTVKEAIADTIKIIEEKGIGKGKINYRLRDAIFSRQRYWGEPFPVYYKDDMPYVLDESKLPLELPDVDKYLPTEDGEPPLARAKNWKTEEGYQLECNTMPGFAGSSAYYYRYMDPWNDKEYFSKEANEYWENVDLYIGGSEHATGHLIYARFWNKFLFDLGMTVKDEPFKKLINQGMIQGRSSIVYRIKGTNKFVSFNLKEDYDVTPINVDINFVENDILDIEAFKNWNTDFADAEFILEGDKYICGSEVEKMSKSLHNVVNPDDLTDKYGADTLRLYEMFLGPLEQSKPWDTNGIEGVYRFMRKLWKLYQNKENNFHVSDEAANSKELKVLHKTIKKIQEDIERFSFNTAVSSFMICVNELTDLKCNKREILEPLAILISSYAPHIAEELWQLLGHNESITYTDFPELKKELLIEDIVTYPVSFNGKMRFKIDLPADMSKEEIEKTVLAAEEAQKWTEGKPPKKIIVVSGRIINIVL